jgi:ADP-heptose:LPS heptosyltransferase
VVAIFGPTSPLRWGPRGPTHQAVSLGLDCAPCSNVGGPRCPRADRDHACLRELEVEPVLEAALSALGAEAR